MIYEVNLEVDADAAADYAVWLEGHVREILALPGFLRAEWLALEDDAADGKVRWTIRYHLASRADLDRYFAEYAERFRADGLRRFGGRFTASRRVFSELRRF